MAVHLNDYCTQGFYFGSVNPLVYSILRSDEMYYTIVYSLQTAKLMMNIL